jgi:ABC-type transport system involved in cytochrome c biogenesis permease subunit
MAYVEGDIPWSEVLASMGFLLGAVLALFASTKRSDRFFDLGVDGLLILIPMLAWSGERI